MHPSPDFDCVIVGSGIVGLAHALAAAKLGLKVAVVERDARALGASIRNFGFVTVTGQEAGPTWRRARRSRDVWAEVAPLAGIDIIHRGLYVCARRKEAVAVLEEFAGTVMGEGCSMLGPQALRAVSPAFRGDLSGALYSPHDLRLESRTAIPKLTAWLAKAHGVAFLTRRAVLSVETGRVETTLGPLAAPLIIVCPGPDLVTLFPDVMARRDITLCKLHMLRVAPPPWRLPGAVMSDFGLVRYLGYAGSPSLGALRKRLEFERPDMLADGIHLIVVQGEDGSLVVGDSHHYADSPDPFQPNEVDRRILGELSDTLEIAHPETVERWIGVYPSGPAPCFTETPAKDVRLVMVTSGTGASTSFAIAEETMAELTGRTLPAHMLECRT